MTTKRILLVLAVVVTAASFGCTNRAPPSPDGGTAAGEGEGEGESAGGEGEGESGTFTTVTCPVSPTVTAAGSCDVVPGSGGMRITGTILLPGQVLEGGSVTVDETGVVTCVACDCPSEGLTQLSCGDAVISPGLINAHDHMGWMDEAPWSATENGVDPAVRWEQRHDWRKGKRSNPKINSGAGDANADARSLGELRFVLSGATSILGSGKGAGFLRNLDQSDDMTALGFQPVDFDTFPLGDSDGTQRTDTCDYPRFAVPKTDRTYAPHVAEGIDASAHNEYRCLSSTSGGGRDLLDGKSAIIHGIGLLPSDIAALAADHTSLIWSPRSNVSLYGDTATVELYDRLGVNIALGTDWILSGSMNMSRELACADELNQGFFGRYFTDEKLWRMVTLNAATALHVEAKVGVLAAGRQADIAIFRRGTGTTPYRAVVSSTPSDVVLVLRGGKVLSGDAPVVAAIDATCDELDVCGAPKRVCSTREAGKALTDLESGAHAKYPLFFCGTPANEPTCLPARTLAADALEGSNPFDGQSSVDDTDGDGIANDVDDCANVFNPIRPLDGGAQSDRDGDGVGDACDPCPLDPGATSCSRFDTDDRDGDGVTNARDNCPDVANADQTDGDADGTGDACDACPDAANAAGAGCPVSVYDIKTGRAAIGQVVSAKHLVVTAIANNGAFAQLDPSSDGYDGVAHSGIFVFTGAVAPPPVGAVFDVTRATVATFHDQLQLSDAQLAVSDARVAIAPTLLPPSEAATVIADRFSSPFDAVLVELDDVTVTDANPTPGDGDVAPTHEFAVDGGLRIDDALFRIDPAPAAGERITALRGIVAWRNGRSKVLPRASDDVRFASVDVAALDGARTFARAGASGATFPDVLTVRLARAAGSDVTVTLTSSDESIAQPLAPTVVIAAGETSAPVNVNALAPGTAALSASIGGTVVTHDVRVLANDEQAAPTSLSPSTARVGVGSSTVFTVALDVPSPGMQLAIAVEPATIGTAPVTLDVPRDALTATFVFVAGTVPGAGSVVVTGTGTGTGRVDIDVVGTEGIVIDLSGFKLVQTGGGTKTFVIPAGTQVPMGGTLLVTRKSEAAELASHFGIVLGPDVVVVNSKDTFLVINATPRQIELQRPDGTTLDGPSAPTANRKTLQRNVPFGPASDPASWTLSDDTASTRGTRTANAGSLAGCYISEVADVDAFASETIEISCEGPIAPP